MRKLFSVCLCVRVCVRVRVCEGECVCAIDFLRVKCVCQGDFCVCDRLPARTVCVYVCVCVYVSLCVCVRDF